MDLFGRDRQQAPQQVQPLKDYTPDFETLGNQIQQLSRVVEQFCKIGQAKELRYEIKTLDNSGITLDTHGYTYVGLVSAAAQTITLTMGGLTFNQNITAGLNRLNIIDGTTITTATPFTCLIYFSDKPFFI